MMTPRSFFILTAVTAVAVLAASVAALDRSRPVTLDAAGESLVPGLDAKLDQVVAVEVAAGEERFTVTNTGSGWALKEREDYPVPEDRVRELLVGLADLKLLEAKTARPDRHARLELEDPAGEDAKSVAVTLRNGAGDALAGTVVGKRRYSVYAGGKGGTYVRRADETQTWLAEGELKVGKTPRDWLDREVLRVDEKQIQRVGVRQPDGTELTAGKETPLANDFVVDDIPEGRKLSSDTAGNRLRNAFAYVDLDDVRPAAGLTFPEPYHQAHMTTFDGFVVTAEIAEIDGEKWARFTARAEPAGAAAQPAATEESAKAEDEGTDESKPLPLPERVAAFNKRTGGWLYRLDDWTTETMSLGMEALLEPLEGKKGS